MKIAHTTCVAAPVVIICMALAASTERLDRPKEESHQTQGAQTKAFIALAGCDSGIPPRLLDSNEDTPIYLYSETRSGGTEYVVTFFVPKPAPSVVLAHKTAEAATHGIVLDRVGVYSAEFRYEDAQLNLTLRGPGRQPVSRPDIEFLDRVGDDRSHVPLMSDMHRGNLFYARLAGRTATFVLVNP